MRSVILSVALCAALGGVQAAETLETAEADGISVPYIPTLSRAKVYRASEKPEALFYGEASAEGGNPVTMSISF